MQTSAQTRPVRAVPRAEPEVLLGGITRSLSTVCLTTHCGDTKGKKIIQARGWFGGWKCFLHRRGWKAELVPWNQCKKPMWRCPSVISAIPQRAGGTRPAIGSRAETTISACLRLSALRKWERITPPPQIVF